MVSASADSDQQNEHPPKPDNRGKENRKRRKPRPGLNWMPGTLLNSGGGAKGKQVT